ncbi:MAG: PQQ-binding-like beta-propeller repeat protein [Planctomycetes bacterium]|nr:PQQ-binding-like beta-propeller repeat protein [Planctomycetota bacterium]
MIELKVSLLWSLAFTVAFFPVASVHAQSPAPWSTYRANPQRTASDGGAGPASPKVLWALKSKDNYIASPVPVGNRLYVSGLGAFNTGNFACLATDANIKSRVLWSKSTPYLKLPTVSSPGVFKNYLVFGDGMHQTNGAVLYCLEATLGAPLWRHSVPGDLVHLEGSPTIVDGKAYIGGGAAGVLCVEIDHAAINGKAYDLPTLQKLMAKAWQALEAKYLIEKKQNPMFAMPPSEDQLPKAEPKRAWQQGKDKWHVDAPVNVIGDKVLVASAFLDKEQVGSRALYCLDAKTGAIVWQAPLKLNPWGGPSVLGDTVIVTGSTIAFDYNILKGAKGLVAAFDLKSGKPRWTKTVTGGTIACAALANGSAVVTSTDGKVRAFDVATGDRQWIYDAKMPLFAPAAIAKDTVYAGDLRGVLHAMDLRTGAAKWKLDLGQDKAVQAPGMIYGGPVVQGGRLYVATCNLQGPYAGKATAVVCVGEK